MAKTIRTLRQKVIEAAVLFVEETLDEMSALEGTESHSAPAEFMLLHEAVEELVKVDTIAAGVRSKRRGDGSAAPTE